MHVAAYTPSLYLPGGILGRFRSYGYPRVTRTPIPGAGYRAKRLVWAPQKLNLDGGSGPYVYGRYDAVPLLGLGMDTAQANAAMGWSPARLKKYWDARARACQNVGDEGICLARVARHVPVTLGDSGDGLGGLGISLSAGQVASVADAAASLLRDPGAMLSTQGPAIVAALDRYVIGPTLDLSARRAAPYLLKYILPPIAILYVIGGLGLYYSYIAARRSGGGMKANRRRRRRRR